MEGFLQSRSRLCHLITNWVWAFHPHLQLPYTLQWNASIEQALGKSQAFTVSYVGSHALKIAEEDLIVSSSNPNTSSLISSQNGLTSDYDSLQFQFRRKAEPRTDGLGLIHFLALYRLWLAELTASDTSGGIATSMSGTIFRLLSPMICRTWDTTPL